jgi:oligopeptide/dipeptide ABC transporter ATP-binding protein
MVMYAGQIVESGSVATLFGTPRMPYTRALLQSLPRLGRARLLKAIPGTVPSALAFPEGCAFHPRCRDAVSGLCDVGAPHLEMDVDGHFVRCLRWREIGEAMA